jgi:hypothetical protein
MDPWWQFAAAVAAGFTLAGCTSVRTVLLLAMLVYGATIPAGFLTGLPLVAVLQASSTLVLALEFGYCAGLLLQLLADRHASQTPHGTPRRQRGLF